MPLTLNQVLARLETLALSHKQINHFYFGDPVEWLANGEVVYPAVFVDMSSGSISKANKLTGWDFEVWFCDLGDTAEKARANELEVQSDLTSIAEDYRAMLGYTGYDDWEVGETTPLQYFVEKFEDLMIAVRMQVRIDKRFDSNRCAVPSETNFENDPDMKLINNYIYRGGGTEGLSVTISTLQTATVLFVMKGDKTLTPALDPQAITENEYYKGEGSALIKFGTEVELDQIIQILYR